MARRSTLTSTELLEKVTFKTSFTPTDQQIRILEAMEIQKAQEKLQGKSAWQIKQDKVNQAKMKIWQSKQKSQAFRNRTNEEILQNFIKVQSQKELAGDFGTSINPSNLNVNISGMGYDINKPETIPISVVQKTPLDTAVKMLSAGVHSSIIETRIRHQTMPNQSQLGTTINTSVPLQKTVNFTGTGSISPTQQRQPKIQTMFVPMIQHQATEPVGNPTLPINVSTSVNTEGIGGLPPTLTEKTSRMMSNITESEKINSTLPLLAGVFLLGM